MVLCQPARQKVGHTVFADGGCKVFTDVKKYVKYMSLKVANASEATSKVGSCT